MCGKVVDGALDGAAVEKLFEVVAHKRSVEGVGVVEVDLVALLVREVRAVLVIVVVRQDCHVIIPLGAVGLRSCKPRVAGRDVHRRRRPHVRKLRQNDLFDRSFAAARSAGQPHNEWFAISAIRHVALQKLHAAGLKPFKPQSRLGSFDFLVCK